MKNVILVMCGIVVTTNLVSAKNNEETQIKEIEPKVASISINNTLEQKNKELAEALKEASSRAKLLQEQLEKQKKTYEARLKEQSGFFETQCEKKNEALKKLQLECENIKTEKARLLQENFSKSSLIEDLTDSSPTLVLQR